MLLAVAPLWLRRVIAVIGRENQGRIGMSENRFRVAVVTLLVVLIGLQLLILSRLPTPVTIASVIAAPQEKKADLIKQVPLVRVQGGSVDVDVQNTPIEVEISR